MDNKEFLDLASDILLGDKMLCPGRMANLIHYAMQVNSLPGDMVEFGCYTGRTAALLALVTGRPLWLYDSFEGLPIQKPQDEGGCFGAGDFVAKEEQVYEWFAKFDLPKPNVYKGWFNAIPAENIPPKISFAYLDGDRYESTLDSLRLVYPRLGRGGVCLIDDYGWAGCPGTKIAVYEFMADKPENVMVLSVLNPDAAQAVIIKI